MNPLPLIVLLACVAVGAARADTAVPPLVNYQGTLTDESGAAIPDGMKKLEFNLYDAALAGNLVWGPQVFDNVPVVGGRFNVILGTTDSQGRSVTDAFGASERYLSFKVGNAGADLSGVKELAPRQRILSAPFALRALHGVPVGSIMAYFGNTAPEGWLLCDGRALTDTSLKDSKFAALKAHLTGLGSSAIPDLRGRVIAGPDQMGQAAANRILNANGRSLGQAGGEENHTLTTNEMPGHTHPYNDIYYSESWATVPVPGAWGSGKTDQDNKGFEMARTTGGSGGGASHNNMPPYMIVTYMIKY